MNERLTRREVFAIESVMFGFNSQDVSLIRSQLDQAVINIRKEFVTGFTTYLTIPTSAPRFRLRNDHLTGVGPVVGNVATEFEIRFDDGLIQWIDGHTFGGAPFPTELGKS